MDNEINYTIGIMGLTWLIVILSLAFTPYFIRKNISFGVSVPENEYQNPLLKALRHKYTIVCVSSGLILATASTACYLCLDPETAVWIQLVSMILYMTISAISFFYMRKKVKAIKQESEWLVDTKVAVEIRDQSESNKTLNTKWYFLYILIIVFTILIAVFKYPSLPGEIPMHYNIAGEIDRYSPKSASIFAIMPIMQLLIGILFAGINITISTSKRQRDFKKSNAFRAIMSRTLFAMGFMVMLLFTGIQLAMLMMISEKLMSILPIAFLIVIAIICAYLAIRVGQGGSRLKGSDDNPINMVDDDSQWVGGFFYYNKNDPSIFVEKRFGIGYTLNFGNWLSLLIIIALLVLIAGLLIVPLIIK